MFTIDSSNKIKVIKGDTGLLALAFDSYQFVEGDVVYFTVKDTLSDSAPSVIKKKITEFRDGAAIIMLETEDTDIEPKVYFYDVQVNLKDGRVDTVIKPSKFIVLGGVTGNEWIR